MNIHGFLSCSILGMICSLLIISSAVGESDEKTLTEPQKSCSFERTVTKQVKGDYLLYLPQDYGKDKDKLWPLVLHLHGMGERGSDVNIVRGHGLPNLVERGRQFPFILVSPQCPDGTTWNYETDMLIALLDEIESKYKVDKNRIYLTGLSMGGYGTWALAPKQPDRFAAIAPICGGGNPENAALIKDIPMWVFHGEDDDVVPLSESKEMVDAVKAAGGYPKFTTYPGVGHDAWDPTYENEEFWKWLLEQKKK